jgi:hypothetical protein
MRAEFIFQGLNTVTGDKPHGTSQVILKALDSQKCGGEVNNVHGTMQRP